MSLEPPQQPQSLRKHRQTLVPNAQRAQKKDYGMLKVPGNEQLPSVGVKDKEKVGKMVKKRFSSRPTMPPDAYDHSAMPSLPSNAAAMISSANEMPSPISEKPPQPLIPPQHSQRDGRRPSRPKEQEPARETLEVSSFDAQRYISQELSSATDVEIAEFADKLAAMQESLTAEKKEAMYKNYKTFLHVGKEINYLSSEIDTLRKFLNDLHSATSAMKEDAENVLSQHEFSNTRRPSQGSMNSLTVPGPADNSNGLAVPRARGRNAAANRSSMIFLEEDYGKQLASLYRHVEGARQYLPNAQGRRVVKESGGWYQLNAATWKPFQPVSLFLLNDHLLVATKKRVRHGDNLTPQAGGGGGGGGGSSSNSRLVAEQCWPLQEIEVAELIPKNSRDPNATNALCIKAGALSFVYRADKPTAHADFYPKLKQVKASLRKEDAQGAKREHQARLQDSMDYYARQTPTLRSHRNLLESYSEVRKSSHSRESSMDLSGRSKSLRDLDEMVNDLDVKIAYRNFAEAVEIIESNLKSLVHQKTSKTDAQAENMLAMSATAAAGSLSSKETEALTKQVLKMKLEQRAQQMIDILVHELSQSYLSRSQVQDNVVLLIQLQAGDTAKKTLLESRRNIISKRIKQVEFQGDIVGYMTQIAIIYFRLIRSTIDIFSNCFRDVSNTSSVVEWAKEEIDRYILLFSRQLYGIEVSSEIYQACASVTEAESRQLKDVGLDLSFMLDEIYNPKKQ